MTQTHTVDGDDEEQHRYHGLPAMIGEAITHENYGVHHSGGYIVRRKESGAILVYRSVEHAKTREELDDEGDYVAEMYDYVLAGRRYCRLEPPEDGWESEIEELPESIWGGWE